MRTLLTLACLGMLWGCGDQGAERSENPDPKDECAGLSWMECSELPDCRMIGGLRYDGELSCRYLIEEIACSGDPLCTERTAILALDPEGRQWGLDSSCVPPGWTKVEAPRSSVDAVINSSLCADYDDRCMAHSTPSACAAAGCRMIQGRAIDLEESCVGSLVDLQCTQQGCGDGATTLAQDPDSLEFWQFPTTCLPSGWTELGAQRPEGLKEAASRFCEPF